MKADKQNKNNGSYLSIFVIQEDPLLGWIIEPYAIWADTHDFSYEFYKVYAHTLADYDIEADTHYEQIFQLKEEITEAALKTNFVKKGRGKPTTLSAFMADGKSKLLVREYIDTRLAKMLAHIEELGEKVQTGRPNLFIQYKKADKLTKYPLAFSEDKIDGTFNFTRVADGIYYALTPVIAGKETNLQGQQAIIFTSEPGWILIGNKLHKTAGNLTGKNFQPFLKEGQVFIPKKLEKDYFKKFILKTLSNSRVEAEGFDVQEITDMPKPIVRPQPDLFSNNYVLQLYFRYQNQEFKWNDEKANHLSIDFNEDDEIRVLRINRNKEFEADCVEKLLTFGLNQASSGFELAEAKPSSEEKSSQTEILYTYCAWLSEKRPKLNKKGFEIEIFTPGGKELLPYKPQLNMHIETIDNDWLDINAVVTIGDFSFPFLRFKNHLLNRQREFELPNGKIAILPEEWFARYRDMFGLAKENGERLRLSRSQSGLLASEAKGSQLQVPVLEDNVQINLVPQPQKLRAKLRPYQLLGMNWMNNLREQKVGGCLADEMGLGKTLQSIALLLHIKENKLIEPAAVKIPEAQPAGQMDLFATFRQELQNIDRLRVLVVMPLSLIHNWQREIEKFAPSIKVHKHVGSHRTGISNIFHLYDIILTTYAMVRNDEELFSSFNFSYLIVDESQHIKNPKSKTYKVVKNIKAQHRLVLTGTPIENSLSDLWAQMNLVNPGMLGSLEFFRNNFIVPIEKQRDAGQQKKLRDLVAPLILRRRIEQVATELPELNEQVFYSEMEPGQKKLYETEKSRARNKILENIRQFGKAKSNILILKSLMKLRQIANHPQLAGIKDGAIAGEGEDEADENFDSGKFNDVTNQIQQVVSEEHKVLVFSQFVRHLELYEQWLKQEQIEYCLLTGQSGREEREEMIGKFQQNPGVKVFLISLKAGGTGLNLTAANYVFLLDPWWNPAVEAQAVGRAYRIGQEKRVFAYRFITIGSVEEKILKLKQRKQQLADDFLPEGNQVPLDEEDVKELFS